MKTSVALNTYCIGLDMSMDKFDACLMAEYVDRSQKVLATKKFDNTPQGFVLLSEWVQKHCKVATATRLYVMETTGAYHEELAWYLFRKDAQVSVEPAKKIKHFGISLGVKTKNDKADAQVIARYGLSKPLQLWKPISKTIYDLRLLTRQRSALQCQKNQLVNQLHALAHTGYENDWMRQQILPIVALLDQQIEAFEAQARKMVEADSVLKKKMACLCSIKGLGFIPALTVVAETNGFANIHNLKQLTSYAGYDTAERQSGKYKGITKISKQGNARIRAALFFPSLNVVKFNQTFKNMQARIYERTKIKMKGYVAVQRKLLCLTYTLWKTDTEFKDDFEQTKDPKTIVEKRDASLPEIVSRETSLLSNAKIPVIC